MTDPIFITKRVSGAQWLDASIQSSILLWSDVDKQWMLVHKPRLGKAVHRAFLPKTWRLT